MPRKKEASPGEPKTFRVGRIEDRGAVINIDRRDGIDRRRTRRSDHPKIDRSIRGKSERTAKGRADPLS